MRRIVDWLGGGWSLLLLLFFPAVGLKLFPVIASPLFTAPLFHATIQQSRVQIPSLSTSASSNDKSSNDKSSSGSAPNHFQESFTSYQALAYTVGADWNTTSQQLTLQLQDNVRQQNVMVVSAQPANPNNAYLYVVWQDLRNDGGDIYLQKLDTQGHRLWTHDQRVNSDDGAATQTAPAAVVDATGNILIVWVDDRNGNHDIYAQHFSPQGAGLWAEDLRIHDDTGTADQGAPVVASTDNGLAIITWHDNRAGDYNIYLQALDDNGARQWPTDRRVNQDTSRAAQTDPAVSVAADGTMLVAWLDRRIGNGDLYMQRLSPQGDCLWPQEVRVNGATAQAANRPALTRLTNGTSVISWLDPVDNHIYLQSFDQQGKPRWATPVRANQLNQPANADGAPTLAPLGSGLLVAWERAQDRGIYAQAVSEQGVLQWVSEQRAITMAGDVAPNAGLPSLAATGAQGAILAWSDQRNQGNGDVYVQEINQTGQRVWAADALANDAAGTVDQTLADVATTEAGVSTLIWQDRRVGGLAQLYLQRILPDGQEVWAKPIPVPQTGLTAYEQHAPRIANLGDETVVVWSASVNGVARLYLQRIDAAGNQVWTQPQPIGPGATAQQHPALAINQQGDVFVAWETAQTATSQLELLRLDANGVAQWHTPTTLYNAASPARLPDLAVDQLGNVYATWLVTTAEGTDVYLQKINQAGEPIWPAPVLVNSAPGLANRFNAPALATTATGETLVVWVDNRESGVFVQRFDPAGQKLWEKDLLLTATPGTFSPKPTLASTPDGGAVVVWQGLQQGTAVINAQRISPAGALLWQGSNSVAVLVSQGGLRAAAPQLALDSNGVSSIVWCDERRNNPDIFMQSLDTAGQRRWPADVAITQPDRFYQKDGLAESRTVDRVEQEIRQATLTADFALHGGTVDFAITNDGATWQSVVLGTRIVFTTTGSDLRWRAQLHTNPYDPATAPLIRAVQIDYDTVPPLAENDRYESDDGCNLAQALQPDGAAQQHMLVAQPSAPRDEDWLRLTLHEGQKYILWAAPAGRTDALQLELYTTCGAAAAATVQSVAGQSASLQWTATTTSTHFVRMSAPDNVASTSANNAPLQYQVGVRTVRTPGLAILVAGRLPAGAAEQAIIDQTTDRVYQTLQQQGYPPAQIHYLGHATGVTRQALQTAIQSWAVTQQNPAPAGEVQPLLLYLAGRGSVDRFYLNETESVTPALLNLWLSNLEAHAPIQPMMVILEAAQAGSFITTNQVISDTELLAAPNRIVVAATNARGSVWHTSQGLLFSNIFWSKLASGQPVQQSFQTARQAVYEAGYFCQNAEVWCQAPWLDDTGLGLPNPDMTGGLAAGQGLAGPAQGPGPQIQRVTTAWNESTRTLSLEAQLVVSNPATQVEAQLISAQQPPILAENAAFPVPQPIIGLTKVAESPLSPPLQLQIYRGTYAIPIDRGNFWVSVHAWDSAGVFALPFGLQFQNGFQVYLPIVAR